MSPFIASHTRRSLFWSAIVATTLVLVQPLLGLLPINAGPWTRCIVAGPLPAISSETWARTRVYLFSPRASLELDMDPFSHPENNPWRGLPSPLPTSAFASPMLAIDSREYDLVEVPYLVGGESVFRRQYRPPKLPESSISPIGDDSLMIDSVGFPFRCARLEWHRLNDSLQISGGFGALPILGDSERLLPFRPEWRGLFSNWLLFFSTSALLLFSYLLPLTWYRRRRGRCIRCGHPVLASSFARCTECGAPTESVVRANPVSSPIAGV